MDNYIKLCAEMAYNDVLIESYFEEELSLNEADKGSFVEKVKKFFAGIKAFIQNLFGKVIQFFKDCIKKISDKFSSKEKKDEKKKETKVTKVDKLDGKNLKKIVDRKKNESALLYDSLMEMVLTEGTDYGLVAVDIYEKHSKNLRDVYSQMKETMQKIDGIEEAAFEKYMADDKYPVEEYLERIDKLFDNISTKEIENIDADCKKELEDKSDSSGVFDRKADDHLIRYFHRDLDIQSQNLSREIEWVERHQKSIEENIAKYTSDHVSGRLKLSQRSYSHYAKLLTKVEKGYIDLLRNIIIMANKSKVKDLKTEHPDGSTSYRV